MPIYEYELLDGDCKTCGGRFELMRPINRAPLTACPLCKKPVRKVISSVNTPRLTKPTSVSDAKSAGFQVLKRRDKGVYEKL
jgi:putative FmdB family regulatory protein